jgi:hypothetical protein
MKRRQPIAWVLFVVSSACAGWSLTLGDKVGYMVGAAELLVALGVVALAWHD